MAETFRIAMFGTIPDFDKYSDYSKFIDDLVKWGDAMGFDGQTLAHKYISKDFITPVKHSSGRAIHVTVDKESILPKIYQAFGTNIAAGDLEIEYILKKSFKLDVPECVFDQPNVHDCDANVEIPHIAPCDIVYIDYETLMYIERYNKLRSYDLVVKLCEDFAPIMKSNALLVVDDPHALFGETSEKVSPPLSHARIQMNGAHATHHAFQKILRKKGRNDIASTFDIEADGKNEPEKKFLQCCRWYENKHTNDYTLILRRL